MKKLLLLLLPVTLSACDGGNVTIPNGSVFDAHGAVSGSQVGVEVTYSTNEDGNVYVKNTVYSLTQPNVLFTARAGSIGGLVTAAQVNVLDASGNQYAGEAGEYPMNFSARITPGWVCQTAEGGIDYDVDPTLGGESCAALQPLTRTTSESISISQLISPQVAEFAASNCASAFGCDANLTADIDFYVVDDNGVNREIEVNNVPISVYVTYEVEEGEGQ